jgi:hypothetical protein
VTDLNPYPHRISEEAVTPVSRNVVRRIVACIYESMKYFAMFYEQLFMFYIQVCVQYSVLEFGPI